MNEHLFRFCQKSVEIYLYLTLDWFFGTFHRYKFCSLFRRCYVLMPIILKCDCFVKISLANYIHWIEIPLFTQTSLWAHFDWREVHTHIYVSLKSGHSFFFEKRWWNSNQIICQHHPNAKILMHIIKWATRVAYR